MTDTVRVLRIIEYVGPRDLVERQLSRSLYGERIGAGGLVRIRAATIGEYPEILEPSAPSPPAPSVQTPTKETT